MIEHIHFRCPCCHGSQYRTSQFDVTEKPFWCEMHFLQISHDDIRYHPSSSRACTPLPKHSNKMMKPVNAGGEISPVIRPGQHLFLTRSDRRWHGLGGYQATLLSG